MKPIFKQYDNGLRLIYNKVETTRPASIFIGVDVGSCKEDKVTNGISHFIEHLTFKGTPTRTSKQISTELEEIGANANAFTSKSMTGFYATCLNEKLEESLEILSDIVFNSKYDEEEIIRERNVIFEEIDMYEDDPESVAYEEFCKNFYAGSPLQMAIIGTKESLSAMKQKDILKYVKTHYVPQNVVVSVVASFPLSQIEKLVKKYIGNKFTKKQQVEAKVKSQVVVPDKSFSFIKKDIQQTQVVMGFPCGNIYSEEKMAYNLLTFIFGGGMGSRLFQKVREEHGLVYSINCSPELYEMGGAITISFGTNATNQVKAIELVKAEIDNLVENGFTEKELARAKTFCKSLIVSGYETGSSIARSNAKNILTYNRIILPEEKLQEIDSVTLENLNEIAKRIFNYSNVCGCAVSNKPNEELFNIFN